MQERRGVAARLGIAALNILVPGLGLLRLRRPREALAFWVVLPVFLALLGLFWAVAGILPFWLVMLSAGLVALIVLGTSGASAWKSWSLSGHRDPPPLPIWARWYSLVAVYFVLGTSLSLLVTEGLHRLYKPFYLPAESMEPTLRKNDRMIASMRPPATLKRGDVILLAVRDGLYVKRIAALPGDKIALRDGQVILNGRAIGQRLVGNATVQTPWGVGPARRLVEQFPGESRPHEILDAGPGDFDDYPETLVKPGHLFVLGDNRDLSADSRVSHDLHGVEQASIGDVRGVALYYTYGPSRRWGERITP